MPDKPSCRGAFWRVIVVASLAPCAVAQETATRPAAVFAPELLHWTPYAGNPVFAGSGGDTWDRKIRERGYILREGPLWRLWYTGYNDARSEMRFLGLATSADGLHWTRDPANPIHAASWVEDVCVVKQGDTYSLFAEGRHDQAHWLISPDGLHWSEQGTLDIRTTSGQPFSPGPFGTPTVWVEGARWYLFYERRDAGVWLASSTDQKVWTNVQDTPVLEPGPDAYDRYAIALDQVIRYQGRYYGVYHATAEQPWRNWTTCLAVSDDLIHWEKYPGNPIVSGDSSSGILVPDGPRWRLYTMHPEVRLFLPK